MSKGSAPAPIEESQYSKSMGDIAQKQYDYYNQNYKPFEDKLLAEANRSPLAGLADAQAAFTAGNAMQNGIQRRATARYGNMTSPEQQAAMLRTAGLNSTAALTKGTTEFGTQAINQNIALKGQMAGVGMNMVNQATGGLGTANSNYIAQQQQYQQAVQAQNQANMGSTNSLIGLAGSAIGAAALL
jgi:hypothetical protein